MDDDLRFAEIVKRPLAGRLRGYWGLTGPGYLQSAMTLGGGTIASCVLLGSIAGYDLLWVQPLAILLGVLTLSVVARQTLNAQTPPYAEFWNRLHPLLAIAWATAALVATVLWHIPQYGLAANGVLVIGEGFGLSLDSLGGRIAIGAATLGAACVVLRLYHQGASGLKLYELTVKVLVWAIVLAFGVAALASDIDWGRLFLGFTGISFLRQLSASGLNPDALEPIVGGVAAAVGINMVFLYPYSLLKKSWGKKHLELAHFDLVSGMMVPFLFATSLMIIAVANTIGPAPGEAGLGVKDMREIIPVLDGILGGTMARLMIGLGMFAVAFSTIITHMLASGFIGCELFNLPHSGRARAFFSLLPAVGVIGVVIKFPFAAAVTASVLAAPLMPVAVVGFLILLNTRSYMGEAMPRGGWRVFWNSVLVTSIIVMSGGAYYAVVPKIKTLLAPAPAAVTAPVPAVAETPPTAMAPQATPPARLELAHEAMGATFELVLYAPAAGVGQEEMRPTAEAVWRDIDGLESRISNWRSDSLASQINREAAVRPISLNDDLAALLQTAKRLHADTGGAFDPTVGPLLEVWGFYAKDVQRPTDAALKQALDCTGLDHVVLDSAEQSVRFDKPCVRLDFGGIGKGLAADRAGALLRERGYRDALINAGTSTVLALGTPPGHEGWTVHVSQPYNRQGAPLDTVTLRDESLSTSAAFEDRLEIEQKRYGHILDPRTGWPVDDTVLSATAIAPLAIDSDALSTAFFVLGLEGTRAYCRAHPEVRAIVVLEEDGQPTPVRINFEPNKEQA